MPKASETVLELDLGALEHNYNHLKSRLSPETLFMAVVKAYAYGSDAIEIALKLESLGVDYFAVAYIKEAIVLREAGIKTRILVLHPLPANFKSLFEYDLEPSIYSPRILREFLSACKKEGQESFPIHLKFNTGLNRLGFWENDVDFVLNEIKDRNEIQLVSLFSHLAATEDPNERQFTEQQINSFNKIALDIERKLGYSLCKHLLNTSGIFNYPEAQLDMVRSGIGLYGFGNDKEFDQELIPVATLKTVISQLHKIEPNESVGYNRAYTSAGYRMTATLPIGHADGIGRHFGKGKTFVNVNGSLAPIIGNVCMDMIMLDVTGIDCKEGDEVVVFGKNPNADSFAATANTISYELITGISQRVKRVVIES